ncbi:MAG TPA: secretin N-terminal domain-containing protein [Verrucomicrobiae bacterium]|nr:secretin N-terminal domain-containing protein [Verrucomicrobiae bacterium]
MNTPQSNPTQPHGQTSGCRWTAPGSAPEWIGMSVLRLLLLLLLGAPWPGRAQPMPMPGRIIMPSGGPPSPASPPGPGQGESGAKGNGPWLPSEPPVGLIDTNEPIQLSFQGANIDMIVQWLAQTTGKTVIKSPRAQCQLTIASPKKVSPREAIALVYRALALEGYSIVESGQSILIVPKDEQPRMSPLLISGSEKEIPSGRERLMKIFSLKHAQASQLQARMQGALSDQGTIQVDPSANQLIIADFNENLRVAGDLIEALDKDIPEDVAIRVIALKNMSAQDLAKELTPLYQKLTSKTPEDMADVVADDRSNSLIILSSQSTFSSLAKMIAALDIEGAQEKATQVFELKNADAQDVAKQLQDLSEGSSSSSSARMPFFIFGGSPGQDNSKRMSIVADRRRNAVIVQAPPAKMESIGKMITDLDAPVPGESLAPKIYHLKYASATDVEDVLNALFTKRQQARSYWDYYFGDDSGQSSSSSSEAGRLYGKVRITSEPYSNTIIVTSNSKENLGVVEEVLRELDRPSESGESTFQVKLKFAKAATVANTLNILFAKNGSPPLRQDQPQNQQQNNQQQQPPQTMTGYTQTGFNLEDEAKEQGYYPWLGGQPDTYRGNDRTSSQQISDLVGRVRAVADERGNSVLVSASVHFFPQIIKILDQMDAPTDQVSIEARIVEVQSDFLDQLGVRWSPNGNQVFTADDYDNSIMAHFNTEYQKGYGANTLVNSPPASSSTLPQVLTQLRSGVLDSTINVDYLIQFLHRTTDMTVLGNPQITISDNEMGKLFVGQDVPIPGNTLVSSVGSQNTSITYMGVGVVLEVTPHISNSGDVQLKIHAESSAVVPGQTILGGVVISSRNFRTELTARNGQTLVLGGIIQKQISKTVRKTPILGDIPGLGWAFKKKDSSSQQVELMVFLRPHVARSQEDMQDILRRLDEQAPQLKKLQEPEPAMKGTGS